MTNSFSRYQRSTCQNSYVCDFKFPYRISLVVMWFTIFRKKVMCSSETLETSYLTTWWHNPDGHNMNLHGCVNLKSALTAVTRISDRHTGIPKCNDGDVCNKSCPLEVGVNQRHCSSPAGFYRSCCGLSDATSYVWSNNSSQIWGSRPLTTKSAAIF
jgi:hypothetical protein